MSCGSPGLLLINNPDRKTVWWLIHHLEIAQYPWLRKDTENPHLIFNSALVTITKGQKTIAVKLNLYCFVESYGDWTEIGCSLWKKRGSKRRMEHHSDQDKSYLTREGQQNFPKFWIEKAAAFSAGDVWKLVAQPCTEHLRILHLYNIKCNVMKENLWRWQEGLCVGPLLIVKTLTASNQNVSLQIRLLQGQSSLKILCVLKMNIKG